MPDHSNNTISEAIQIWTGLTIDNFAVKALDQISFPLTTSSSGSQAFMDGCEYAWKVEEDGEQKDLKDGHISLTPVDDLGHCQSAHLTIVGGDGAHYFFHIDETGARPAEPPHHGHNQHNGNALPEPLRGDIEKILDRLLTFPPAEQGKEY